MTIIKGAHSNSHALSQKDNAQRSFTFGRSIKFASPSRKFSGSDNALQATNPRRRYMRRGSKCPAMLFMTAAQLYQLEDVGRIHKERRLSLMSALRSTLESTSLMDNLDNTDVLAASQTHHLEQLTPDEKRQYTYHLLSEISQV
jgi:hypothetical protein